MDISFIIPVYNVEQFIAKAVFSVIETDWKDLEYEIIVVDDESPDGSVKVITDIILKNPFLPIRIISQKNKGLGGARNTGLSNAVGKYVFFLDSDDYIISETFPYLIETAKRYDLDVLEFAASRVDSNYQLINNVFSNTTDNQILTGNQYVTEINFANSACNKLYKSYFLKTNDIVFLERVYIEDAPFNVEVLSKASKVMAVNTIGAAYLQNTNSITRSKRTSSYLTKFIDDSILVTDRINLLSTAYNKKASEKIHKKVAYFLTGILWMTLMGKGIKWAERKKLLKELKGKSLYPYYHKTGSLPRDFFLLIINILGSLRIL